MELITLLINILPQRTIGSSVPCEPYQKPTIPKPNVQFLLPWYCGSALSRWVTIDGLGPQTHVTYTVLEQARGHINRKVPVPIAGKLIMDRIHHPGWTLRIPGEAETLHPQNLSRLLPKES